MSVVRDVVPVVTDWRDSNTGEKGVAVEVEEALFAMFLTPREARRMARKLIVEAERADGRRIKMDYLRVGVTPPRSITTDGRR